MERKEVNDIVEKYRDEAIGFLTEVLQTPSPSGEELQVSKVLKKYMEKEGFDVGVYCETEERPNLIATWTGKEDGPTFLFMGHMDVFPPVEADPGTYGPWSGKIVDGNIYGRGSADMKAGLVAGIMAAKLLKRSGYIPKGKIKIACTCDEERDSKYGVKYLLPKGLLDADFGVNMEASEEHIVAKSDAIVFAKVTYTAENSLPVGKNTRKDALQKALLAIERMYSYDEMLKKERYHFGEQNYGAILSIDVLHLENDSEGKPVSCTFEIDRRYTAGETLESVKAEMQEILDGLRDESSDMEYELEITFEDIMMDVDEGCDCIKAAEYALESVFKKDITFLRRCSGGDAGLVSLNCNFPLPHVGPGRFDQLCIPDEHVSIQEFLDYIKVYMLMVQELL